MFEIRSLPARRVVALAVIGIAGLAAAGCGSSADPGAAEPAVAAETEAATSPAASTELAASHVLIQWVGAERAPETITRTKEEALALARQVADRAHAGETFEQLAKDHSDGPTGPRGGRLGTFPVSQMVPEFTAACLKLEVGEISDPVESAYGYHIIRRDETVPIVEIAASHVLIQYSGAEQAAATVIRTRDEAEKLAGELAVRARDGEDFATLAEEHSDDRGSAARGGDLPVVPSNQMMPEFSIACLSVEPGQIAGPVETAYGFHVIRRNQVQRAGARHILVMHAQSVRVPPTVVRTPAEARARCEEALVKARQGGDFAALATEYSDGPTKANGGDLGVFVKGAMVPEFDEALFALEPGQLSGVVETPFGYHVIQRYQ